MKKANDTFETFKMLNAELSQEDNYFMRECQFKESYLKFKKSEIRQKIIYNMYGDLKRSDYIR